MAEEWRQIRVSLKNDDLEAYINVPSGGEEGAPKTILTVDDARKALKDKGIVSGIMEGELERIFRESVFDEEVLAASGTPPKHAENARIEYFFETAREFNPEEDDTGRIDYHETSLLVNVRKGDQLCRRIPPTTGKPGKSLTDKEIPPKEGRDIVLPEGPNTALSPNDPDLLIASTSGCVSLNTSKLVEVKPKLEIKGNVDYKTGNIKFIGSLLIGGDIKAGFKVNVTGDLEVGGVVEDAEIEAGGNALIKKGFIGHSKGSITTGGDLTIKFAQNQNIFCGGNLNTGGELMHCKAKVGGNVNAYSHKGAIIGGDWQVVGSVEAYQYGSISDTQTQIAVGCDFKLQERKEEINQEFKKIQENQEKIKNALHKLSRLKIKLKGVLPPEQEKLYERLQETINHYPQYKTELENELGGIEKVASGHKNVHVKVGYVLYPGVKVVIGKFTRVFKEKLERTTLREIKGEIVPAA